MSDERIKDLQRQIAKLSGSIAHLAGDQPTLLFREFASEYLRAKLRNPTLRAATKASFENQVRKHLIPRFGLLPLDKLTNAEWLYWVTEEKEITRFFNARKALIEIMTAARNDGHIEKLPKFENPDEPRNVGRALSEKEILSIIWHSARPFRFIFYTFYKLGCRPREILKWEFSMLRWNGSSAWIDIPARISKTGRARSIPINTGVARILYKRHLRGNGSDFVFPAGRDTRRPRLTYQSAFTRSCSRAGVTNAMVYDFRRSFVSRAAAEGKPLVYIAKYLDTSVAMLEKVYAKSQAAVMEDIAK